MIQVVESPIDRLAVMEAVSRPDSGALVTFDGTVRNHARGKPVTHLYYETYREMALREMEKIRQRALQKWSVSELAIVHRVGRLDIGESSVFVAVSSPHRPEAFQACRFTIDTLKTTVPIWKREHYQDGEVWIEGYGG